MTLTKRISPLDDRQEFLLRLLRTLLEETRGVLQDWAPADEVAALEARIDRLQREAERLAPDFAPETSEMERQVADFPPF